MGPSVISAALLAVCLLSCRGARINTQATTECPADKFAVTETTKHDCVEIETQAIVPQHCCDQVRECSSEIQSITSPTGSLSLRMQQYAMVCMMQQSDFGAGFSILNPSKLCASACQASELLQSSLSLDDELLMEKCSDHESMARTQAMLTMVENLDEAWATCSTEEAVQTTDSAETPEDDASSGQDCPATADWNRISQRCHGVNGQFVNSKCCTKECPTIKEWNVKSKRCHATTGEFIETKCCTEGCTTFVTWDGARCHGPDGKFVKTACCNDLS